MNIKILLITLGLATAVVVGLRFGKRYVQTQPQMTRLRCIKIRVSPFVHQIGPW